MSESEYICCNYCKWFKPTYYDIYTVSGSGYCNNKCMPARRGGSFSPITNCCISGFEHTIHNYYGLPYPEYSKEYTQALEMRARLFWDIKLVSAYKPEYQKFLTE